MFRYTHQKKEHLLNFTISEILFNMIHDEKFSNYVNNSLISLAKKLSKMNSFEEFYQMNINDKLELLIFLINLCYGL